MNSPRLSVSLGLLCLVQFSAPHYLDAEDAGEQAQLVKFGDDIKPFLTAYCVQCHGSDEQNGDRRFDRLNGAIPDENTLIDYQDILDQLNLGEMPPADEKQPKKDERKRVIDWLTTNIRQYHKTHRDTASETVLRRLNAREYRNTIRDLLHVNTVIFDPTTTFPKDRTTEHLDNIGETLVTSGYLLARYFDAAELVIDKAMFPAKKPEVQSWTFRDGFRQQPEIDKVHRTMNGYKHMTLYDVRGADKHEGAYGPIHAFSKGVPYDGFYDIRINAEAVNREHPYDADFLGTDSTEPLRLGIVPGDRTVGQLHKPQPIEPLLAEIDLADEAKWYTVRVWLDAGYTPRFTFENGLMDARNLWSRIIKKYPDQFPKQKRPGIVEARFNAIKYSKLPQIHIHEIEISGPHYDQWPTKSQRAILGDDWESVVGSGEMTADQSRRHLTRFLSNAYRRPATDSEVERVQQIIAIRKREGRSTIEAYSDGLKAALSSPNFLFLDETAEDDQLSDYALASRLSFFLWSSIPDAELMRLAASGKLSNSETLKSQVDRMLNDSKSDAFVDGFLGAWLTLNDLGATPPDRRDFREFYHYDLDHAMREETRLFTRHLIDDNLSVMNFLDSDFTFVNKRLARHYDLDVNLDDAFTFEEVSLNDPRRGGLLGQASVLTVTANGIDTSPVVRGVWLLENVLGTPPSPPPPDVEPLDPDIRGAKTVRDQLMQHRDNPACNDCHRKIDPLGFALENFDPIGGWREKYDGKKRIDSSGELPGGKEFQDLQGLKTILLAQPDTFLRGLTQKLMAYSIGRELVASDRPHVDQITTALKRDSDGFRDLIAMIVLSQPFRSQ